MSQPNRWTEFEAWCDYMIDYCDKQIEKNEFIHSAFYAEEAERNIRYHKANKRLLEIRKKHYQETGDSYPPDTEEVRALKEEKIKNDTILNFFYGIKKENK